MRSRLPLLVSLALAACAAYDGRGLTVGASTESEVRGTMGQPAVDLPVEGGGHLLAYPRGPLGTQTFMASIAGDGRLVRIEQVLDDDHFLRIRPGQMRDEVLRRIGPPGETMEFPRLRQVAWDYRFIDTWGYTAIFSVMLDESGAVVSKTTRRLEGRDRGDR